ncbi:multiheme c-type cytochrome [Fibrobacterota bacterium]
MTPSVFTCAVCHTTGYNRDGHQDSLPGIIGTWYEEGVQCEACHGPGSVHAKTRKKEDINIDYFVCKNCHSYKDHDVIEVDAYGMIQPNQQWEEIQAGPHSTGNPQFAEKGCVTCHSNPHTPYAYNEASSPVDKSEICLKSCHTRDRWKGKTGMPDAMDQCAVCHMPYIVSGGLPANLFLDSSRNGYYPHSSVRSHLVPILSDPFLTAADTMYDSSFTEVVLKTNADGRAYMTLDRACIGCHDSYHAVFEGSPNPQLALDSLGKIDMRTFPLDPYLVPPQ